jgi:hypothetical protein
MGVRSRDITELTTAVEESSATAANAATALLARARDSVAQAVSTYPRASLVSALAAGFLLARLVRRAGERGWS